MNYTNFFLITEARSGRRKDSNEEYFASKTSPRFSEQETALRTRGAKQGSFDLLLDQDNFQPAPVRRSCERIFFGDKITLRDPVSRNAKKISNRFN
jgi:hypothetical protein